MKGRKSKLPNFIIALKEVLKDKRSVILTDPELLVACNHRLKPKERVATSTFEFWKTATLNKKSPENIDSIDSEMVEEFRELLAYARVEQKLNLTSGIMDAKNKNQWGSTWILERKFKDLQLKQQHQEIHQPLIQITASNDEHKKLIQSIMNGESIQLQPAKAEEVNYDEPEYVEVIKEDSINPQIDNE